MNHLQIDQTEQTLVNLNHETRRNLERLEQQLQAERRKRLRRRRYVSRAEKQILSFLVMVLAACCGIALSLCGQTVAGFFALGTAGAALAVSTHYDS